MVKNAILALALLVAVAWGAKIYEGTYTVGVGKDYANLKDAADSIGGFLTGDLWFLLYAPFTQKAVATFDDSLKGFVQGIAQANPAYGIFSSPNFIHDSINGNFINISVKGENGTVIIENLYIKQMITAAAGRAILATTHDNVKLVIHKNMIDGQNKLAIGMQIASNTSWGFIQNNVVIGLTSYGIYSAATTGALRYWNICNNTVDSCVTGLYLALPTGYFKNNISRGNSTVDFEVAANNYHYTQYNVSSDTTSTANTWYKAGPTAVHHGSLISKSKTDLYKTIDITTDSAFQPKPLIVNYGIQPVSPYACTDIQGNYLSDTGMEVGAYGVNRDLARPTNARAIRWPNYGHLQAKLKVVNLYRYLDPVFVNKRGDTLPFYIDSVRVDTSILIVNSRRVLPYGDSIYMGYTLNTEKIQSDANRTVSKNGLIVAHNKQDSIWNTHNQGFADVVIDTTGYSAWPGIAISTNKKTLYCVYRQTPNDVHVYDNAGYLKLRAYDIDTITGRLKSLTKDTTIFNCEGLDERDPSIMIYNTGTIDRYVVSFNILDTGVVAPFYTRVGIYIIYSDDTCKTWSDSIKIDADKNCNHRMPVQLLSNDTLMVCGYNLMAADPCSLFTHKAHKNHIATWTTTLMAESPALALLNETQAIELKNGSKYDGKMVALSRSEKASTFHYVAWSYDYGRTWTVPVEQNTIGVPTQTNTVRFPLSITRLDNGKTIFVVGGQGGFNGFWGYSYATEDEFSTFKIQPKVWIKHTAARYYPSVAEWKSGKLYIARCTNISGSDIFLNYYNLNDRLSHVDSTVGYTNNFKTGYKPRYTDSTVVFGTKNDGKKGMIFQHVEQGTLIDNIGNGGILHFPLDIEITARFDSVAYFGINLDTSYQKLTAPEGTYRVEAISTGKGIHFSTIKDSIFVLDADNWGVPLNNDPTKFASYKIQWRRNSVAVYKNDTLYGTKESGPTWFGRFVLNLQSDSSSVEIKRFVAMPPLGTVGSKTIDTMALDTLVCDTGEYRITNVATIGHLQTAGGGTKIIAGTLTAGTVSIGGTAGSPDTLQGAGAGATLDLTGNQTVTWADPVYVKDMALAAGDTVTLTTGIDGGGNTGAWIFPSSATNRRNRGWLGLGVWIMP